MERGSAGEADAVGIGCCRAGRAGGSEGVGGAAAAEEVWSEGFGWLGWLDLFAACEYDSAGGAICCGAKGALTTLARCFCEVKGALTALTRGCCEAKGTLATLTRGRV